MVHNNRTIDVLIEYYEAGENLGFICQTLGIRPSAARYYLMKNGAWRFKSREELPNRATKRGKTWTKEDDQKLLDMRASGCTLTACSHALGRPYWAISYRLISLAAPESYREDTL